MLLLIDNFDSFTYNIAQDFRALGKEVKVVTNDQIGISEIRDLDPEGLVIGPGPDSPKDAGISKEVIRIFAGQIPILGVCLGHQAIGEVFGGKTVPALVPMHGKTSNIFHKESELFSDMSQGFLATRYHSLVIDRNTLPIELEITAETKEKEIMGISHRSFPLFGVQFHPEAILSKEGMKIMENFCKIQVKVLSKRTSV